MTIAVESQFKSNCEEARKKKIDFQRFNGLLRNWLNCNSDAMVTSSSHLFLCSLQFISFSDSFLSRFALHVWVHHGQTSQAVFRFISRDFIHIEVETVARIYNVEC